MNSILNTIKKMIGIAEEYTHFDLDIINHINTAFAILNQLGVGPDNGFIIKDESDEWDSYGDFSDHQLEMIKTYIARRVQIFFDPPQSSVLQDAYNKNIAELEWRLNIVFDNK